MRRLVAIVLASICAMSLSVACEAPMELRMALTLREDNTVEASVLLCGYEKVNIIELADDDAPEFAWRAEDPDQESYEKGPRWSHLTLLETPGPSWDVTKQSLTSFVDGPHYSLRVIMIAGPSPFLTFTLSDLRELSDDQVLAATQRGASAMSRDSFEESALETC